MTRARDQLANQLAIDRLASRFAEVDHFAETLTDPASTGTKRNAVLCCIFSALVVAICGVQLTSYAHRPETETFSMVPMAQVEPQVLRVTTECSVKWGCTPGATKNGSNWTWSGLVRIEQTGDCDDEHSEDRRLLGAAHNQHVPPHGF